MPAYPASYRGSYFPGYSERFVGSPSSGALPGVTQDATSGKYVPATLAEWQTVLTAAGLDSATFAPSALWLMQEAAGNLADSIGAFTLTASGAPSYQQSVTGWTRKAVTFPDAAAGAFANISTPDLASNDVLTFAIVRFPSAIPAGTRNIIQVGTLATRLAAEIIPATGLLRGRHNTNTADSAASECDGNVHAVWTQSDRTNSLATICTEEVKVNPVFSAGAAGAGIRFGAATGGGATSINGAWLYAVNFHGGAARMSDAQKKTLLQTLGWVVAW